MIYNTERVGRSAYYERPSRKRKKAEKAKAQADICVNCMARAATEAANCSGGINDSIYRCYVSVCFGVLCAYVAGIRKRRRDKLFLSNSLVCFFPYFWM